MLCTVLPAISLCSIGVDVAGVEFENPEAIVSGQKPILRSDLLPDTTQSLFSYVSNSPKAWGLNRLWELHKQKSTLAFVLLVIVKNGVRRAA